MKLKANRVGGYKIKKRGAIHVFLLVLLAGYIVAVRNVAFPKI